MPLKCNAALILTLIPCAEGSLKCKKKSKIYTEEFFSQHAQLLLGEALTSEGGKLPTEDLGELAPGGPRRVAEERQVLSDQKGCTSWTSNNNVNNNDNNSGSPWVHQSEGCTT